MKVHKTLLRLTGINAIACFLLFLSLYYFSSRSGNDMGIMLVLGWILWLGIVAIIEPLFFSDGTRAEWFSKKFGVGTLLILLGNVFLGIVCNFIAYSFIPAK
jgi:hypothetical protein